MRDIAEQEEQAMVKSLHWEKEMKLAHAVENNRRGADMLSYLLRRPRGYIQVPSNDQCHP